MDDEYLTMTVNEDNIEVKYEDDEQLNISSGSSPPVDDIEEVIPDYSKAVPLDKKR